MKNKIDRVLFIGSKQLGLRVLQEMLSLSPETLMGAVTIDDSKDSRTRFVDFRAFAEEHSLDLRIAKDRKHSEQLFGELKPDLCIVVCWYWLISSSALEAVPFGFIGIHNSLLPKYRGGSPLVWQIIQGEHDVGFSMFSFTTGMDAGPIWAQVSMSVGEHEYISSTLEKLEIRTIDAFRETYPRILNRSIEPVEQNHELATYCAQRVPRDGNIDWHDAARDVDNFIRAQSDPYPGAFTYLEGQELKIWKARPYRFKFRGTPGQVARIASDGIYVICGNDRAIILEEVELDGKRGKAADFIKSIEARMSDAPHGGR